MLEALHNPSLRPQLEAFLARSGERNPPARRSPGARRLVGARDRAHRHLARARSVRAGTRREPVRHEPVAFACKTAVADGPGTTQVSDTDIPRLSTITLQRLSSDHNV